MKECILSKLLKKCLSGKILPANYDKKSNEIFYPIDVKWLILKENYFH